MAVLSESMNFTGDDAVKTTVRYLELKSFVASTSVVRIIILLAKPFLLSIVIKT